MKLSDIESKQLLPRFAKKISWVIDTLDALIRPTVERVKSIDAPLTMESIQACTDEELEALYDQYGVAQYYPDLSRDTRDKMLYEMARIYRYLGTPHAIETLCEYIFDGVQLNVKVLDNLAFNDAGELVDESLLDTFDIQVEPSIPVLDEYTNTRILANIIRFSRNSQALRDILYDFPETFELPVSPLYAGIPSQNWENDIVCEPVTPPTPSYQEITLYMASGSKRCQLSVSSSFTGNVNSERVYQLYTDEECTTPWTGYDYSNDYEVGRYVDGEWNRYTDSVSAMPSSIAILGIGYILMDTGALWLCCNSRSSTSVDVTNIVVRIYPKGQQYYAFYASNSYGNQSVTSGTRIGLVGGMNVATTVPWGTTDTTLPVIELVCVLGSAGNQVSSSGLSFATIADLYQLSNNSGATIKIRTVVFKLSTPTHYCYPNNINTDTTINSSTNYQMFDVDGDNIPYESNVEYRVIGMFKANGDAATRTWSFLNKMELFGNASNNLCLKYTGNETLTFYKVWYTKTPKS